MERIVKLGIGVERPGEIVYEARLSADHAEGFARQIRKLWDLHHAQIQDHADEDLFVHLIVEVEDRDWGDFELEDEILALLDP
jgi:hypothetical protein